MVSDNNIQKSFEEFMKEQKKPTKQATFDNFSEQKAPAKEAPAAVPEKKEVPQAPAAPQAPAKPKDVPAQAPTTPEAKPSSMTMSDDEQLAMRAMKDGKLDYDLFSKLKAEADQKNQHAAEVSDHIFEQVEDVPDEEMKEIYAGGVIDESKLQGFMDKKLAERDEARKITAQKFLNGVGGKKAYNKLYQMSKPGYVTAVGIADAVASMGKLPSEPSVMRLTDENGRQVEAEVVPTEKGNLRISFTYPTKLKNGRKFQKKETVTMPMTQDEAGNVMLNKNVINRNLEYWKEFVQGLTEEHEAIPEYSKLLDVIQSNADNLRGGKIPKFRSQ